MLDGYLFRPAGEGKRAAVVFLHGCGGLFSRASGFINPRELDWARELTQRGYAVLMVDSFGPRNQGEMCSQQGFNREIYMKRPRDAYGAVFFLQSQAWVRPARVGLMCWSEGGGALIFAIRAQSLGRPAQLPQADFRAAVAFYPASCNERRQGAWMSTVPLLALLGAEDVWTPAAPCKELLDGAIARCKGRDTGLSGRLSRFRLAQHGAPRVAEFSHRRRRCPDPRNRSRRAPGCTLPRPRLPRSLPVERTRQPVGPRSDAVGQVGSRGLL